jgi:hypothetical protein
MKKRVIVGISAVLILFVGYFVVKGNKSNEGADIIVDVQSGRFQVNIETTGELEAKSSTKIVGPTRLRDFRLYNVAINDIVEEGTVVKKGAWVADLDKSELLGKIQDAQLEVDKKQSLFTQTQLDTTLVMRQARDELVNLEYGVKERQIELDQSQYEPPATKRQAEMNLEKAKRALTQAQENYYIKEDQNEAKMQEVNADLQKEKRDFAGMLEVMGQFTVIAPEDGMVIYRKGFDGKAVKEGSTISAWDPTVAELPDLSVMISKTFVNEVDVRKIKPGQKVDIGLDAFPEKKLKGTVTKVANVGEQRPNSDAKVFLVTIQVHGQDDLLRPAMTTSNKIIAQVVDSTLFVPLETLHTESDSINFVYKRVGLNIVKQEVMVGETNSNDAIILSGVDADDRLYLSIPASAQDEPVVLIPEMDGKRRQPEAEEEVIVPDEKTFTLPDGRVIKAGQGGQRPGGGAGRGAAKK